MFGLCFCLEYLEGSCLTGQSRFTFYVFFEYIANVSLISVCRAQCHTIMISPCWAQRVGGSIGNEKSRLHYGNSKLTID